MKKNITLPFPIVLAHFIFMLVITAFVVVPKIISAQSVADLLVHFDQSGGDSWINTGNVGIGTTSPTGDLEIYGPQGTDALVWDGGQARLRHDFDALVWDRQAFNILLDANNDQNVSSFSILRDAPSSDQAVKSVHLNIDGTDSSWIDTGGGQICIGKCL